MSEVMERPAEQAAPTRPNMTSAQMIEKYVLLRDKIAEIKKSHSTQLAPFNTALAQIEAFLLDDINKLGADSIKTENGTAYTAVRTSATVNEWSKTLEYIQQNDAWELLEARVSKTAVLARIEETQAPVPGVKVTQDMTLNVRRS